MTVRERARVSRELGSNPSIQHLWARSSITGELQIQVIGDDGRAIYVFIPPNAGRPVDLLCYATPKQWGTSRSFLDAVRMGHLSVTLDTQKTKS